LSKTFIGYIRVSTKQQISGNSLSYQKEAIEPYCESNYIDLVNIYSDEGFSAYKERPQFKTGINQIRTNPRINGIIVNELSRFGRSTIELIQLINEINQLGKQFVSIKESINIST
jgi:site-specific DNA recombinase